MTSRWLTLPFFFVLELDLDIFGTSFPTRNQIFFYSSSLKMMIFTLCYFFLQQFKSLRLSLCLDFYSLEKYHFLQDEHWKRFLTEFYRVFRNFPFKSNVFFLNTYHRYDSYFELPNGRRISSNFHHFIR